MVLGATAASAPWVLGSLQGFHAALVVLGCCLLLIGIALGPFLLTRFVDPPSSVVAAGHCALRDTKPTTGWTPLVLPFERNEDGEVWLSSGTERWIPLHPGVQRQVDGFRKVRGETVHRKLVSMGSIGGLVPLRTWVEADAPEPPPAPRPGWARTGTRTPPPAGWVDQEPGWPEAGCSAAHSSGFSTPSQAVDALEDAFDELRDTDGGGATALQDYLTALRSLYILDSDMAPRKGTYGRLARVTSVHLREAPYLVAVGAIDTQLDHLAEDLRDCGDPDLVQKGRSLQRALDTARRTPVR